MKPPAGASFSFDGTPADFRFRPDIDHLNFSELDAGASFGALAKTVAVICEDCKKQCDKFPKIAECVACGKACQKCADECRKV